jgi:hypothetical protein
LPSGLLKLDVVPVLLCMRGKKISRAEWEATVASAERHASADVPKSEGSLVGVSAVGTPGVLVAASPGPASRATATSSGSAELPVLRDALRKRSAEEYGRLDHDSLVKLLVNRDDFIASAQKRIRQLTSERDSLSAKLQVALTEEADPNQLWLVSRIGSSWLTEGSIVSIAIRRNLSNMAAKDVSLAILSDISRQTVFKCEVETGAAYLTSVAVWHRHMESLLLDRTCDRNRIDLAVHAFQSDATTSSVWGNSKLTGLKLTSAYNLAEVSDKKGFAETCPSKVSFSDLQRTPSSSTELK